jgi:hypothetical protein
MTSAAPSPSQQESAPVEAGGDYFATEAHYLSLARRVLAALSGGGFAVVAGDRPASSHLISHALRKLADPDFEVIEIRCGPEFRADALSRAGLVAAKLPAGGGPAALPQTPEPAAPLFVFDEADRLTDQQLGEVCAAVRHGVRQKAAGVLLVRPDFAARLEDPSLQLLKEELTARLRFDEIGEDEGIDFLRHQLVARHHREEPRRAPRIVFLGFTALGALATIGLGAVLALHYVTMAGQPSAPSTPPVAATPRAAPIAQTPPAAPPVPVAKPATPRPTPSEPAGIPQPAASSATVAPASPQPTSPAASPPLPRSAANQRLSPAEIAALVSRGDGFLSAGDIASARLFYERAADAGDSAAALRLAATYDPGFLDRAGIRGIPGDAAQAEAWYRRARELGAAAERQKNPNQPGR